MIIWEEDFETCGNTVNCGGDRYTSTNDFSEDETDTEDYFGRVRASDRVYFLTDMPSTAIIDLENNYTGQNGNFYYAGEDVDDIGGGIGSPDQDDLKELIIPNINIVGGTNLEFRGLFAAGENSPCSMNKYDNFDFIEVYYNVDGAGEVKALCFNADLECNIPGDVSNEPLYFDPNCDGDGGEGTLLTNTFAEFAFSIPTGNSLDLRILIHMDASDEEVAFDYFRVFSDSPIIPVELTSFQAKAEKSGNLLAWTTASEINNDYFLVEKSPNGKEFKTIGRVEGAGTTVTAQKYTFLDETVNSNAVSYYRLKQVDLPEGENNDRKFEYSDVVAVSRSAKENFVAFPNPTTGQVQIDGIGDAPFKIINQVGKTVLSGQAVSSTIDLSTLPNGVYFIHSVVADESIVLRIMKH
ncbi:MAG: T9SS type A sorting domain-containing protein [Bacteroidota bacterium]